MVGQRGGGTYLVARGACARVYNASLDEVDPGCEEAVEEGVEGDGDGGVGFCGVEAEGVVPVEAGGAEEEGGVAEGEADVGEGVGLGEVQGVQVGGDGVVGGVF